MNLIDFLIKYFIFIFVTINCCRDGCSGGCGRKRRGLDAFGFSKPKRKVTFCQK